MDHEFQWKRDKRFVHMTGKPETVSEYPASLVVVDRRTERRNGVHEEDGCVRSCR